jgi:hypothetical protein
MVSIATAARTKTGIIALNIGVLGRPRPSEMDRHGGS